MGLKMSKYVIILIRGRIIQPLEEYSAHSAPKKIKYFFPNKNILLPERKIISTTIAHVQQQPTGKKQANKRIIYI